jgi:hypothetical protein
MPRDSSLGLRRSPAVGSLDRHRRADNACVVLEGRGHNLGVRASC